MNNNLSWILFLMMQCVFVLSHPIQSQEVANVENGQQHSYNGDTIPNHESVRSLHDEQVISVRITSSVAVGRSKGIPQKNTTLISENITPTMDIIMINDDNNTETTDIPLILEGANIEFIKQLNAKKEAKEHNPEQVIKLEHPFELILKNQHNNEDELLEESSSTINENDDVDYIEDFPLARKIPAPLFANRLHEKETSVVLNVNETYILKYEEPTNQYNNSNRNNTLAESSSTSDFDGSNKSSNHVENIARSSLYSVIESGEIKNINELEKKVQVTSKYDEFTSQTDDSIAEPSIESVLEVVTKNNENDDSIKDTQNKPTPMSQQNYFQDFRNKPTNGRENSARLTTVSFSIVHDIPKVSASYNEPSTYNSPSQTVKEQHNFYQSPKIYSEPARIYSEPAKFYSEPAKIYSEPAKIYSEPAKVYSEPAKIYSEPAKFYSEPASLHLNPNVSPNYSSWQHQSSTTKVSSATLDTDPVTTVANPSDTPTTRRIGEHQPEKNYEVDEKDSVLTNGRSYGVQETTTEKCKQDNCKVGYVVEGRQFKKYRVEERTSDGFIVGEYGVLRNEDGDLRGVRYTADSDASPRLISDALMKFLQLR